MQAGGFSGDRNNGADGGRLTRSFGMLLTVLVALRLTGLVPQEWLNSAEQVGTVTLVGLFLAGSTLWTFRHPGQFAVRVLHIGLLIALIVVAIILLFGMLFVAPDRAWVEPATPYIATGLMLTALTLWVLDRGTRATILLSLLLPQFIAAVALYGFAIWLLGFDPLLQRTVNGPVVLCPSAGLLLVALGLAAAQPRHMLHQSWSRKILYVSMTMVLVTSLFVALLIGAMAARHLYLQEEQGMAEVLEERTHHLMRAVDWRLTGFRELARRLEYAAARAGNGLPALSEMMSLLAQGGEYHFLAVVDAQGQRLADFGEMPAAATARLPLRGEFLADLVQVDDADMLSLQIPLRLDGGATGLLVGWIPLDPGGLLPGMNDALGASGEMMLCTSTANGLFCLPGRHDETSFELPSLRNGQPLPMTRALAGEHGVGVFSDYRGVEVLVAFGPLGSSGLGMVLKRDLSDLHPEILHELAHAAWLWLMLAALGLALVHMQVGPLTRSLADNERHFRELVESSPDWIWEVDRKGAYVYVSPTVAALLGFQPEELLGRHFSDLMPAREAVRVKSIFRELSNRREPMRALENVMLHRDGHEVVMETSGVPMFDAQGYWLGYRGIDRDITAQHQMVEALRRSEDRFRTLVQHASDGIVLLAPDRRFLELNDVACRLLGGSREQLLGMRPDDLLLPEELPAMREAMALLQAGGSTLASRRLRQLDGTVITVEISSQGLADGTMISLLRDVTEQERRDKVLRRSEQLHRTVVEVLAEGLVVQDTAGKIITYNRAAGDILGRPGDDAKGRDSNDPAWAVIHEDGSPFPGDTHPAMVTLRSGEPQRGVVMGVMRADGERVWISVNSELLRDETGGEVLGVVTSFEDITTRLATERALHDSRDRLRALTAHLQEVREKEKAEVARELHDELGGTLMALKIDTVQMLQALPSGSVLHSKLDGMAALVDSAVGAIRRIVTELRPTVLDDLGLWAAMEWQARQFEQRTGVRCFLRLECEEVVLPSRHALALFRLMQEALTNVSRHAHASQVEVDCWRYEDVLHLTIHDNGIGMNEDIRIQPTSHGIRGMYERLGEIGARLEIHSTPGDGTMLVVHLPLLGNEGEHSG